MCLRNIVVSALGWTYLGVTLLRGGGISFECETCIFVTCLSVFFPRKVSSCLLELVLFVNLTCVYREPVYFEDKSSSQRGSIKTDFTICIFIKFTCTCYEMTV
jgi:hypothetical protein